MFVYSSGRTADEVDAERDREEGSWAEADALWREFS